MSADNPELRRELMLSGSFPSGEQQESSGTPPRGKMWTYRVIGAALFAYVSVGLVAAELQY
ncbi:hypothetical protein [Corynebacterium glyciniphilum]|uniref:hypothetical protein n=1 Tax=Corynebacterium glyciniphilum TaxID=1404244 RepID=UPI0011AB72BE|nr:hypothetical protein [Corynebacterium glyciniphilum]